MSDSQSLESSTLIDLAEHELKNYADFHRIKRKLRGMMKVGILSKRQLSTFKSSSNDTKSEKDGIGNFDSN